MISTHWLVVWDEDFLQRDKLSPYTPFFLKTGRIRRINSNSNMKWVLKSHTPIRRQRKLSIFKQIVESLVNK